MVPSTSTEALSNFSFICEKFIESFNQGDAQGLAELYTENSQILPPNMELIDGRQGIQAYWQGALEMDIKSFKPELLEAERSGDMGYLVGKYTVYGEGEQSLDEGKYISILKQIDGEWKVHREIFNSSIQAEEN